jgi:two-component system sensor histidine kinase KdpD
VLRRRPQVALVDELAHTNVPECGRHTKRWQDVLELLDAEIDVVARSNGTADGQRPSEQWLPGGGA